MLSTSKHSAISIRDADATVMELVSPRDWNSSEQTDLTVLRDGLNSMITTMLEEHYSNFKTGKQILALRDLLNERFPQIMQLQTLIQTAMPNSTINIAKVIVGMEDLNMPLLTQLAGKAGLLYQAAMQEVDQKQVDFLDKFNISVLGDGLVAVDLGETPRIEFLQQAQELAKELYGRNCIHPQRLEKWASANVERFSSNPDAVIKVNGNVQDSASLELEARIEQGLDDVRMDDLAVAYAAYYIVTGKNLFSDGATLCKVLVDGSLQYAALYRSDKGLAEHSPPTTDPSYLRSYDYPITSSKAI